MRVVLVAYHFPPDPEVGSLRARKVAEVFLRHGHEVHVIAAPLAASLRDEVVPGLTVHRIPAAMGLRAVYLRWKRAAALGPSTAVQLSEPVAAKSGWQDPEKPSALRRYLGSLLWLPDDRQGWIVPATRAAMRVARGKETLAYTTVPPFSAHLVGLLLKRLTGMRWAAEFRDPWTDNPGKPAHVRSRGSDATERWLERRCLAAADHTIAVTESAAELFAQKLPPTRRSRVVVIRNGIDRVLLSAPRVAPQHQSIVYTGNLYVGRDPRPFLNALATLRQRGELPDDLRIDLIGQCRWYRDVSVEHFARQAGISDLVHFIEWLPRDECQRRIEEASILLLLAQNQPAQVPNKLYEYLGTLKPILAFVDAGGESARMLERVGNAHVVTSTDPVTVETMIAAAIASIDRPSPPADPILKEWSTEVQMERLYRTLASGHNGGR